MATTPEKLRLREAAMAARRDLPLDVRRGCTSAIEARALDVLGKTGGSIGAYVAFGDEFNPRGLLEALAAGGRDLALPCTPRWGHPLVFRAWRPGDPLVRGRMNIPEPGPQAPEVFPQVLVGPPVAFDRRCFRIGYGAGFYDRTIPALRARHSVFVLGVAFACQECPAVPDEPHDVPFDAIATQDELILPQAGSPLRERGAMAS
ncbi:MAG: 5-formyltetrahydrofolate cyclo-ligase [Alsobacter sp.]